MNRVFSQIRPIVRSSTRVASRRNFANGPDPNVMARDLFGLASWGAPAGVALLWILYPARARLLPSVFGEDEKEE
eukprot:g4673.t1